MTSKFYHEPFIDSLQAVKSEWKAMKALLERVAADNEPLLPLIEEINQTLTGLQYKPIVFVEGELNDGNKK